VHIPAPCFAYGPWKSSSFLHFFRLAGFINEDPRAHGRAMATASTSEVDAELLEKADEEAWKLLESVLNTKHLDT
jgi:hypothetical protein